VCASLRKWFKNNKLTIHFDKKNFMKFCTNNKPCVDLNIEYGDRITKAVGTTHILGLQIDDTFNRTTHSKHTDILSDQYCFPLPVRLFIIQTIAETGATHPRTIE
jgi:hypothetical protein